MSNHGRVGERGFTIIEVVIAAAVLLVVGSAFAAAASAAVQGSYYVKYKTRATQIASEQIERTRNLPFDSIGTRDPSGGYGNPPGSILSPRRLERFTITTSVRWVTISGQPAYKRVVVTVSYPGGAIREATEVFGVSTLVNAGTLLVTARDRDTGGVIMLAIVRAEPSGFGATLSDSTDASGSVTFQGIAPGDYTLSGSAIGFLDLTAGMMPTQTVAAASVTTADMLFQHPSSLAFTVVDASGTAVPTAELSVLGPFSFATTQSAGLGPVTLADCYIGAYTYTASAPGYVSVSGNTAISTGGQNVVVPTIVLLREALPPPPTAGALRITASDPAGAPLAGVSLVITGPESRTATTDSNGQAVVTSLTAGTYTTVGSKTGYQNATATTVVSLGVMANASLVLGPSGSSTGDLRIIVTDEDGSRLSDWTFRVTGPGGYARERRTDSQGQYLLTGLYPGTYSLWVSRRQSSGSYSRDAQNQANVTAGATAEMIGRPPPW